MSSFLKKRPACRCPDTSGIPPSFKLYESSAQNVILFAPKQPEDENDRSDDVCGRARKEAQYNTAYTRGRAWFKNTPDTSNRVLEPNVDGIHRSQLWDGLAMTAAVSWASTAARRPLPPGPARAASSRRLRRAVRDRPSGTGSVSQVGSG